MLNAVQHSKKQRMFNLAAVLSFTVYSFLVIVFSYFSIFHCHIAFDRRCLLVKDFDQVLLKVLWQKKESDLWPNKTFNPNYTPVF